MESYSKTQVDRLGDRLRKGAISEADLTMLDSYRKSFGEAYEKAIQLIRSNINCELTGRPAKSTSSIIDKLKRESVRLSQVQDIAGCRLVVSDILSQDSVIEALKKSFPETSIVDRRIKPSFGYRAVHLIIPSLGKLIEVQIRTELQHYWAEVSEKFSDQIDPRIKYGGGPGLVQKLLNSLSDYVKETEILEEKVLTAQKKYGNQEVLKKYFDELILTKKTVTHRLLEFIREENIS